MPSYLARKQSNCKNCYKCIRHCPVKSIRFTGEHAHIISGDCILCGNCYVICPQNAKEIISEREKVNYFLQGDDPVIVSLAPSFIAYFEGVGIEAMRDALKAVGYTDVEETAIGATMVKNEYERILNYEDRDIVISSCCNSVNLLIQKFFPDQLPYLANVLSPMQAHCKDIKRRIPNAKTVFIGPCISKKEEADYYKGFTDAVLTFEELEQCLQDHNITLKQERTANPESRARRFPIPGGIIDSMIDKNPEYNYLSINGIDDCMDALEDIKAGHIHKCFIEMNACTGSCSSGPVIRHLKSRPVRNQLAISAYAGDVDFAITQPTADELNKVFERFDNRAQRPSEMEIQSVLRQMGKYKPSDELNCGTCGYNSCRDKAVAVIEGKASISMCLPYLKEKAESFSDTIVKNTPNGIVVLNEYLEVQQVNEQAQKIMNLRREADVLGSQVVRILDPSNFMKVRDSGVGIYNEKTYLAEYGKYVEQTIVPDKESHLLVCIMRDITGDEEERERKERISRETVETADRVVENQMRIVQDIASLLGETAAETKIALTKLKEFISDE